MARSGAADGLVELQDKLADFVHAGGHLVITAANLAALPDGIRDSPMGWQRGRTALVAASGHDCRSIPAGATARVGTQVVREPFAFLACPLAYAANATVVLARLEADNTVLAVQVPTASGGAVVVLASPFGIPTDAVLRPPLRNPIDGPLETPFPLLLHVARILDGAMNRSVLFEAGGALSVTVTRRGPGNYTLLVGNPTLRPQPLQLRSRIGDIVMQQEVPLDRSEVQQIGYLPCGFEGAPIGNGSATSIAGGDVRVFAVAVNEHRVRPVPPSVPQRPAGVAVRADAHWLRGWSLKRAVMRDWSFFEHFDSLSVDYAAVLSLDPATLRSDGDWLRQQGVRVIVDASSGMRLFPQLRMLNNSQASYAASMDALGRLVERMSLLSAAHLVVSLHRFPENNFSPEQSMASFTITLRWLALKCRASGVTLHLRQCWKNPFASLADTWRWIQSVGLSDVVRIAATTALLLDAPVAESAALIRDHSDILFVAAPLRDWNAQLYAESGRLADADAALRADVQRLIRAICATRACAAAPTSRGASPLTLVLDGAPYSTDDDVYRDVVWLESARSAL